MECFEYYIMAFLSNFYQHGEMTCGLIRGTLFCSIFSLYDLLSTYQVLLFFGDLMDYGTVPI
jgi:hypothetical protein